MSLQPAVFHALHQAFERVAPGHREKRDARALDRRVADLHDPSVRKVRNQADPFGRLFLQVPSEPTGKIKHRHVVEREAIVAEHHVQAGDVGSLGLGQFVDVALEKEES